MRRFLSVHNQDKDCDPKIDAALAVECLALDEAEEFDGAAEG